jgi:hypothetical protein
MAQLAKDFYAESRDWDFVEYQTPELSPTLTGRSLIQAVRLVVWIRF